MTGFGFGKGPPLTDEQRAVHDIRADETMALHARIAELEIIAQYAGEDNAMAEQYAARIAEFTANYNDALKTIAAQARTISEMRELIYRASHLVDAAKKCGLQARAALGEKE